MTCFCPGKHTSLKFKHKDSSKSKSYMDATLKIVFVCVNKGSKRKSEMISFIVIKRKKGKIFGSNSNNVFKVWVAP